jgi:hypothetical protein
MSCDNWTYCTAIVDLAPCSSLASDVDDYATPAEENFERTKSLQQGGPRLTADRSKSKGYRHEVRSRTVPDSTHADPEYVWGDEGPIND